GGISSATPNAGPRCGSSPSGPARWAGLWSSCCSAPRAGAAHPPVSNGPFDLGAVLRAAATAFRALSDKHTVVADIPDDLPAASGDTMATDIIVGQLLENAFKYSPDGGTVMVRAEATGAWIEVTVGDEGIGIATGDNERIFDR